MTQPAPPFTHRHSFFMKDGCSLALSRGAAPLLTWKSDVMMGVALCAPGEIRTRVSNVVRAVLGMATPTGAPLSLPCPPDLSAKNFLDRREIGALNIGGPEASA